MKNPNATLEEKALKMMLPKIKKEQLLLLEKSKANNSQEQIEHIEERLKQFLAEVARIESFYTRNLDQLHQELVNIERQVN